MRQVSKCVLLAMFCWSGVAMATPEVDDNSTGPFKWTGPVTVYIHVDPEPGRSRQDQIADAVQRWKDKLAGSNVPAISSVVLDGNGNIPGTSAPPDPAKPGTVVVNWTDQGGGGLTTPQYTGDDTGKKDKDGNPILKNQTYVSEVINIEKGATAFPDLDKAKALHIMMHELGHALGIAHTKESDSIMREKLDSYLNQDKPGDSDLREINLIYTAANGNLHGSVTPVGPHEFRYHYNAEWLGGGEIGLVQIATLGADVSNFQMPVGWEVVGNPFNTPPNIISFRVAPDDTTQAYMNPDATSFDFYFTSSRTPGMTIGWFGAPIDSIVGPSAVPLPSSVLMGGSLLAVLAGAVAVTRRKVVA